MKFRTALLLPLAAAALVALAAPPAAAAPVARQAAPSTTGLTLQVVHQDGPDVTVTWSPMQTSTYRLYDGDRLETIAPAGRIDVFRRHGLTVRHLSPGTHTLTMRVRQPVFVDGHWELRSVVSNPVEVTVAPRADSVPPSAPTDVTMTYDISSCLADFTWTRSTDDVTPRGAISYDVIAHDYLTGMDYVMYYSAAVGTGAVDVVDPDGVAFGLRAADEAGNVSAVVAGY